jgi:hypothetical protein
MPFRKKSVLKIYSERGERLQDFLGNRGLKGSRNMYLSLELISFKNNDATGSHQLCIAHLPKSE